MLDNEFDNFVNGKLNDHAAPVPTGLWDKVADAQFDGFIGNTLKDHTAPVPAGLWDKITDPSAFDHFFSGKLKDHTATVPAGIWNRITDPAPFDAFISGKLKEYTAPVPAGLWEKIHPEETDDRKGFFWFRNPAAGIAALVLVLVGLLGGYLFFSQQPTAPGVLNGSAIGKTTQKAGSQPENSQEGNLPGKQPATAGPLTGNGENEPKTNTEAVTGTTKPGKDAGDSHIGTDHTLTNGQPSSVPGMSSTSATDRAISLYHRSFNNPQFNNGKAGNNVPGLSGKNATAISNSPATTDNAFDFIEPYRSNLLTAVTIPSAINPYTSLPDISAKELAAGNHTSQFRNVVICPTDSKSRNSDLHLEIYTSPDFVFKSVSNNTASPQYLSRKDSSESMRVGFTAGIRLVKPITDNILVKAGLQYSQINQKYVYRTENEVKTITVVSVRTIIRAPGDTVIVRDTSTLQQIGFKNNTVINRFRSFDVPVTIGYQFGNEDLKIGINAGVIFNVSSWYQGVVLDSSLATVPIVKGSSATGYKSNIGLGLYGGISIIKRLSDDLHVFVEPYFRYNLSNMTTPQASYNQKFSLGGLSLGLRFNLNRQ